MGHVPHVYVPGPWPDATIRLTDGIRHHLRKVLRVRAGSTISYTDGKGHIGAGTYGDDEIVRGDEQEVAPASPAIVLAVAPPQSTERARFVVEKAAELAVTELRWLTTLHSGPRIPRRDKADAWAVGALEQSRGAHLMRIGEALDIADVASLDVDLTLAADVGGSPILDVLASHEAGSVAIAVGPEGGFDPQELPENITRVGLGERVLRIETAAIVAAGAARMG